jgi:sugar lactone lactonase YvrE
MLRKLIQGASQVNVSMQPLESQRAVVALLWMTLITGLQVCELKQQAQAPPVSNVQATTAPLASPAGIAFDAVGNMYFADLNNHVIRKVSPAGIITTFAGTEQQGYDGDGGPATSAWLDSPAGIAIDNAGNVYIADTHNNRIRKVVGGTISTIAGTGVSGFSGDGASATQATLNHPVAVAVDVNGNVYIADADNQRIRKISGTTITTVAGNGEQGFGGDGGAAVAAGLDTPNGVAVDAPGNIYIGDTHNQRIRVVNVAGIISTLAGNGDKAYSGDGGSAAAASLARPRGLSIDSLGNLYFADSDNHRIRSITKAGNITTVAGSGEQGSGGDGESALDANLDTPRTPAVKAPGVFVFSDTNNQLIREVGVGAMIQTIAGLSPPSEESLTLTGSSAVVYGSGTLSATFTSDGPAATGQVSLLDIASGSTIGTAPWTANTATFSTSTLSAGTHRLVINYVGDAQNGAITSEVFVLTVSVLPITATATGVALQYGQAIPTLGGSLTGVLAQDAGKVAAVFATTATSSSPVGSYPITVALTGTAAANYTSTLTSNSGSVVIGKTASRVTLSSSNISPFVGSAVTFTAVAASSTTGTPTGSISFLDGGTLLATVAVGGTGSAVFTSSTLAIGVHSITAIYSGDTNFIASTSPALPETITDFTFVVSGASTQSVNPGETASYNFTVQTQSGVTPLAITFTASGLPAGATATFTPSTLPAGSTTTGVALSIQTAGLQAANSRPVRPSQIALLSWSVAFLLPLLRSKRIRASLSRLPRTLLLAAAGVAILGIVGCGGAGFFAHSPTSYTVTVTGTTTGSTTFQHTATVTLIVQ